MQELLERFVLENPTVVLVALFVVAMGATFVYRARKHKAALIVAAAGTVAMAAVVLLAFLIDTDRERIEKMLDDLGGAIVSKDATAFCRICSNSWAFLMATLDPRVSVSSAMSR